MTNIKERIGKRFSMDVAEDVVLNITVLSETEVRYQFAGIDDNDIYSEDTPVITKLEIAYDDIEDMEDYSFWDGIGTRFFLFQFTEIK